MSAGRRKKIKRHSKGDTKRRKSTKRPSTGKKAVSKVSDRRGKSKAGRELSRKRIAGPRLWLFRIIAVAVIPALFFLLIELTLRIAGYGYPATPTVKCKVDGNLYYGDNARFGWRFFPRNIAQEFDPFIFPSDKPDDTYRIFILGASAAQGTPDPAFSFGRILDAMLQNSYPKVNFEVIVAAMPAINSHVAVEIAKDLAKHRPDLFITYLGNNEVVGPYGAGTVFAPLSANLSLIRMGIAIKTTRLGQLLTNLFESAGGNRGAPRVWGGLKMFIEKQVRADDPNLDVVYRHFRRNLEDISRIAVKSGAKVILCTVGSNLKDCPPFTSEHRQGLGEAALKNWSDIYKKGVECESAGDFTEAVEHYLAAAKIDDRYAELQFRLGRCCRAMGQYDKAKEGYIKARELDTLRFRADTRINQIIRAVADNRTAEGVCLVDAAGTFEENSPYKSPGEELFYEHVHLNFEGNYLLAGTVFEQAEDILPERVKRLKADNVSPLTAAECAESIGYNDWARYNNAFKILNYYIKEPPFTNQLYHSEQVSRLERELDALEAVLTPEILQNAAAQFRRLIETEPSDFWLRWRYAELLSVRLKDERAAAGQCRLTLKLLPHSYKPHLLLAMSLRRLNRLDEVIDHLLKVVRIKPTSANAYHNLGLAYQAQARIDEAIKYYSIVVRIQPNNTEAYKNLGELLSQRGEIGRAVEILRRGTLFMPDDLSMHHNLGVLLNMQGSKDEAIKEFQAALRIDPNSAPTRAVLDTLLKERNPASKRADR